MAGRGIKPHSERPEVLLKSLACLISENNDDLANHVYNCMRSNLLEKRDRPQNTLSLYDGGSRDSTKDIDNYLLDRRVVKQYLDTVNPVSAQEFLEYSSRLQNEKSLLAMERLSPMKFLMALGRKKASDETILPQKVKARLKPTKGKAPQPPDSDSSQKSSPTASTTETKLSNSTSQSRTSAPSPSQINGALPYKRQVEAKPPESVLKCSRVSDGIVNLDVGGDLSEWDVIEGLLFVWQGIYSKIFRRCERTQNYFLHEKWHVYPWVREQANNLACLGYLHDTLRPYGETPTDGGLIRKCLAGFVRDQLSVYYALVASIRTNFQKQAQMDPTETVATVTLESLRLQVVAVTRTFMDLISVLEFTREDRGGCLASRVYCFIRHGDPALQTLVKKILDDICQPLYGMLTKWLLEGTFSDSSKEFFIAAGSVATGDRLWQDKYSIRMSMLPEFISVEMAEKILSVGRSINFLRERCDNHQAFAERETLRNQFHARSVEVMYLSEQRTDLEKLVEQAYEETNTQVLEVLLNKYSLLDHFQAHRKFLLLGQGEFVHHLMDLLMEVLQKPASQLHPHYLNSILDSAVRATTAQFEPEDIINRLDAATMLPSEGETGWEVFYLRYHVDGPIGTVFSPSCRNEYQKLFCALWKAKRMEMILSKAWKHQITSAKSLRRIGEMNPVLKQCHELTAEMLHFVRQTQYYFLFEVLECAWNHLIEDIHQAANLDAVITAHTEFLHKVTAGVFMDEAKRKLSLQLRVIYDLVLSLVEQVTKLLDAGEREAKERSVVSSKVGPGALSAGEPSRIEYLKKRRDFVSKFLPDTVSGLRILGKTYRRNIQQFLLTLNTEDDLNLQLLSVRLDFNSCYKRLDARLEAPLTFQHRRMSSIGGELSPILTRKFSGERRKKNRT